MEDKTREGGLSWRRVWLTTLILFPVGISAVVIGFRHLWAGATFDGVVGIFIGFFNLLTVPFVWAVKTVEEK